MRKRMYLGAGKSTHQVEQLVCDNPGQEPQFLSSGPSFQAAKHQSSHLKPCTTNETGLITKISSITIHTSSHQPWHKLMSFTFTH